MTAGKTAATLEELIIIWDEIMKYQDILICILYSERKFNVILTHLFVSM